MNKWILFILLSMNIYTDAVALNLVPSEGWYVDSIHSKKDWLGVYLKNTAKKTEKTVSVNLKTFESNEMTIEQFNTIFPKSIKEKDRINYTLNKCLSTDLEYLSEDSICDSLTLKVNEKQYDFKRNNKENHFFKWETPMNPVMWGDYVVFRVHLPKSKSGDTNKVYKERINGIFSLDLKEQKRVNDLRDGGPRFGGAFITTLVSDEENSVLWVGSQFGIYGLDKNLKEIVSCGFSEDNKNLKIKGFRFVCGVADYVYDSKYEQVNNLIEKAENLKRGIAPPEDISKKFYINSRNRVNEDRRKAGLPLLPVDE